ncbi:MAG: hypothetical protein KatS3mg050_3381 [Litorilinea sp.]|nr:MAG: hypothetical protein KatS3mg050_3381 [Litorilinea sp.]
MGIYYDLGRPVVGGWMGGPWLSHDPVRGLDLIWGGEFGQEGAVLFAVDADSGALVEQHPIGAREFSLVVDPADGRVWIQTYHGLNQPGNLLLSWHPETRRVISHGFPPLSGERFVGAILGEEGRVYIGTHPHGHLVSFDPVTESWQDHGCQAPEPIVPGQQIWCRPQGVSQEGAIVCTIVRTRPGQHIAFHPATGQRQVLEELPSLVPTSTGVHREIQANLYRRAYTVDGVTRTFQYEPSVATDIVGLNKGPDGCIYGSTIISMHLFRFDPNSRRLEDLGRVGFGNGEIYDVIAHGDRLYMGSYTGAYWAVYDPTRPWNPRPEVQGQAPDANPRLIGQLGQRMNRPFEYAVGPDDRIYIACRADYGVTGGGLGRYDPATDALHVFRDEAQSVQSVAADDRFVYGGTSISGGRGCIDPTTQGKLFLFDPAAERRVFECIPISEAIAVTSLAVSPATGLVYGSTDTGHLFAFDREERQVVRRWQLRSRGTPLMGVPETYGIIHLTAGSDGDIYGVTQRDLFKLDVSTDRIVYLDPPPIPDLYQIVEGRPGVFYVGARGHLLEYHLKDTPHYR